MNAATSSGTTARGSPATARDRFLGLALIAPTVMVFAAQSPGVKTTEESLVVIWEFEVMVTVTLELGADPREIS